jgi:hypothetical protein
MHCIRLYNKIDPYLQKNRINQTPIGKWSTYHPSFRRNSKILWWLRCFLYLLYFFVCDLSVIQQSQGCFFVWSNKLRKKESFFFSLYTINIVKRPLVWKKFVTLNWTSDNKIGNTFFSYYSLDTQSNVLKTKFLISSSKCHAIIT